MPKALFTSPGVVFAPLARTLDFEEWGEAFDVSRLYAVLNVTRNRVPYAVAEGAGGVATGLASVAGTLLTLQNDCAGMAANDVLSVIYEQPLGRQAVASSGSVVLASDHGALEVKGYSSNRDMVRVGNSLDTFSDEAASLGETSWDMDAGRGDIIEVLLRAPHQGRGHGQHGDRNGVQDGVHPARDALRVHVHLAFCFPHRDAGGLVDSSQRLKCERLNAFQQRLRGTRVETVVFLLQTRACMLHA